MATPALRLPDWAPRLVAYVNSVNGCGFKWGTTDCGTLMRGALRAQFGKDLLRGIGSYRTKASALKVAREIGPVGAFLESRGFTSVLPNFAQSGDVVLFVATERDHPPIGVAVTGRLLLSNPEEGVGLVRLPLGEWPEGVEVWRAPNE